MKTRIFSGAAATGLALALAGCTGNNTTGTSSVGTSVTATGDIAKVGNSSVSRADLLGFLEAQSGEQVLPYLIDTQLVFEALKDKKLDVTDAEIDADLERRKTQDPTLAATLTAGGNRVAFVRQQIKRELATQKLLTADAKAPTDEQLKTFLTKYGAYYDQPAKIKLGALVSSTKARADVMERALKAKTKTFEQLVEEQKKVSDPAAKGSTASSGDFQTLATLGLPPAAQKQLETLPKGGTTSVQTFPGAFVIFRKADFQPLVKADLAKNRAQIEGEYRMMQAAQVEVKKNPGNPAFDETLKRTKDSIQQQLQQEYQQTMQQAMMSGRMTAPPPPPAPPTLRDVLTAMLIPARNNLLTTLRTAGTVQVSDPAYAKVGESYQPPTQIGANGTPGPNQTPGAAGTPSASGSVPEGAAPAGDAPEGVAPATGATSAAPAAPAVP